jgi:hypothetical protein
VSATANAHTTFTSNMLTRPYCLSELLDLGEVNSAYGQFTYSERPLTFGQDGDGTVIVTGLNGQLSHVVGATQVCGSVVYIVDEWMGSSIESGRLPDGSLYDSSDLNPREVLLLSQAGRRKPLTCSAKNAALVRGTSSMNYLPEEPASASGSGLDTSAIAGITVAAVIVMVLAAIAAIAWHQSWRRRARSVACWHAESEFAHGSVGVSSSLGSSMEGGISADINSATWNLKPSDVQAQLDADGLPVFLGQGAFGVVTQAKLFGVHDVAVKTINHSALDVSYSTFLREVGLLHHISRNRNVVQFYGACQERDSLMIVTELMEGGNLRRALSGDGGAELLWAQRGKEVALDIVRGLCFLHSCKVVHRDMKSSNVLLSKEGTAKICDVGMAVMHEASLSMSVGSIGTFAWAAPELLLGMRCGSKVDIFSTGVILWEIVTGEVPQRGRVFPPEPGPRCPKQLCSIMARCLHVEPSKRPTARELHDLLAACPQR